MPKKEMFINYVPGEECRIAIAEDGRLEEFYHERASSESHVGNIYKGVVVNVEPSIQAAFIDFGLERNGFLHISDLHPKYFPGADHEDTERVGMKTPRRDRPPIQRCLRRGQQIRVQVLKEGIGTKGPTLTSYLSIPGRYLVMMPDMERLGVSRKVEDDDARRAMRKILDELNPPKDFGFIIRTAGIGRTKAEIKRDLAYLQRLWKSIDQRMQEIKNVGELYTESDLIIRTIRDVYSSDIDRIIIDNEPAAQRAHDFLMISNPRASFNVMVYRDPVPLFHRYDIESQIENINLRVVPLPSGGSLVIDSTEALVAIDVNSGKMRENADAETTAYRTNMEATDEICRQLRLRDLGGVIVNDLIDMRDLRRRRAIEQQFRNNLKKDRARTKVLSISQFGILEMTRQRMRPSINTSMFTECAHCKGSGKVRSAESVVLDVMRRLAVVLHLDKVRRAELTVSPEVAFQLLNRKRTQLVSIEQRFQKNVMVRVNSSGTIDYVQIQAFDARDGVVEPSALTQWPEPDLVTIAKGSFVDLDIDDYDDADEVAQAEQSHDDHHPVGDEADEGETLAESVDHEEPVVETAASLDGQPEEPGGKRRRRRRRRGRRGGGGQAGQPGQAVPQNIHQQPHRIGPGMQDERPDDIERNDVLPPAVVDRPISQDGSIPQPTDGVPGQGERRGRRRRRRGRGRGRGDAVQPGGTAGVPMTDSPHPADANGNINDVQEPSIEQDHHDREPVAADDNINADNPATSAEQPKARRPRRRRRSRRGKTDAPSAATDTATDAAPPAPHSEHTESDQG